MWMKDNVKVHLINLLKKTLKDPFEGAFKIPQKKLSEGPVEEGGKDPGQH